MNVLFSFFWTLCNGAFHGVLHFLSVQLHICDLMLINASSWRNNSDSSQALQDRGLRPQRSALWSSSLWWINCTKRLLCRFWLVWHKCWYAQGISKSPQRQWWQNGTLAVPLHPHARPRRLYLCEEGKYNPWMCCLARVFHAVSLFVHFHALLILNLFNLFM